MIAGLAVLIILLYPLWSPGMRRLRKRMRAPRVSGNARIHVSHMIHKADEIDADLDTWGVGPDWVQDRPYPELFEEDE